MLNQFREENLKVIKDLQSEYYKLEKLYKIKKFKYNKEKQFELLNSFTIAESILDRCLVTYQNKYEIEILNSYICHAYTKIGYIKEILDT